MNLRAIKVQSDINLEGIAVEIEKVNQSIRSVTLTDAKGHMVKFHCSYGLEVNVPAEPVKQTQYAIRGKFLGVADINEQFENEWEATAKLAEIEKAAGYPENSGVKIDPVEVDIPF